MSLPALVTSYLDEGESVVADVLLGGDDLLVVTPSRTLLYRAEGLLSDESVSTFPHDVERLEVSSGRRKSTFALTYLDERREFTVHTGRETDVLEAVLGGVLRATGAVADGERVRAAFRFSELTLVVTDGRILKHVGAAVWDADYESFPYADLTGLDYEEGKVATQLVVELDGRPHRVKVPAEEVGAVRKAVESVVFDYHDVGSLAELSEKVGVEREERDSAEAFTSLVDDGSDAAADAADGDDAPAASVESDEAGDPEEWFAEPSADATAAADGDVEERLDALTDAVERQAELLERQQETIERLVDELRRGR